MVVVLSPGHRHESRFVPVLMERGKVKRVGRGRPRLRPRRVAGDKGFSYRPVRAYLRRRGIGAIIPTRSDQRPIPRFDRVAYHARNRVERTINRLKQFRRVATRYEKRAVHYLAVLTLASILLWV
jgi:transposase